MNPGDQMILAKAKLDKKARRLEAQIKSDVDSITYWLNPIVHGNISNIKVSDAAELMADLVESHAEYKGTMQQLKELGD